jgi:hypothetical protein
MSDLRVLICGDRNWNDPGVIQAVLNGLLWEREEGGILTVIEGEARGADRMAGEWAEFEPEWSDNIVLLKFPAQWDKHHKAAGPIRNQQMLVEGKPDVVYAFHDDLENSKGTADMVRRARKAGIPVYNIRRMP